jgi:ATP-dependent Clp protease ATP-binding subunit ClpA
MQLPVLEPYTASPLPISPRAKKVLNLARQEAETAATELRSEHILIGLLRDTGGPAHEVLTFFRVTPESIRDVMKELS